MTNYGKNGACIFNAIMLGRTFGRTDRLTMLRLSDIFILSLI